jgi:hypothetical protein
LRKFIQSKNAFPIVQVFKSFWIKIGGRNMAEPIRISPQVARDKVLDGAALLVCAYQDEEKFRKMHLEGAMSLSLAELAENAEKINNML